METNLQIKLKHNFDNRDHIQKSDISQKYPPPPAKSPINAESRSHSVEFDGK